MDGCYGIDLILIDLYLLADSRYKYIDTGTIPCLFVCVSECMYLCKGEGGMCMHVCTCGFMYVGVCERVCVCMCVCVRVYVCMCMCIYIYICMYVCMYV